MNDEYKYNFFESTHWSHRSFLKQQCVKSNQILRWDSKHTFIKYVDAKNRLGFGKKKKKMICEVRREL